MNQGKLEISGQFCFGGCRGAKHVLCQQASSLADGA